jgi:hypothetical protein
VDASGFSPVRLRSIQQRHRDDTGYIFWAPVASHRISPHPAVLTSKQPNPHPISPAIIFFNQIHLHGAEADSVYS